MPLNRSFVFLTLFLSFGLMAQNNIIFENKASATHNIIVKPENQEIAILLKSYLDQAFLVPFDINPENKSADSKIHLEISSAPNNNEAFIIKSDESDIYLIASDKKKLRYAVYTLLEKWGFRKFIASETYIPEIESVSYPKNNQERITPSFEYRALFYPDAFDEAFRDWHKLDWHPNDFGIWGHSFELLLPVKTNFTSNPELFALYEGNRRPESLCMTNDTVVQIVIGKMREIISKTPDAQFYSVSQNDDVIYCECQQCQEINAKCGGPQGSLYYFLNRIATEFPDTKIITLAYLHTLKPPENLIIADNIYTLFCPIELDRGKVLSQNQPFKNMLESWQNKTSHLYLWDYTVQFSNYMSPFPNLHTFSENYKLYKEKNVKGLFIQGYADVPGDLSELRQYLLAKLAWDVNTDIEVTTNDFLRGFYGKAAKAIKQYLDLLTINQQKGKKYLDIYSGPVQNRDVFLSLEAMDQYDKILDEAETIIKSDAKFAKRVLKLRMALEYTFFEQAKFYGKDKHGMFITDEKGKKHVRKNLTKRVKKFAENCNMLGIYELSEGGLTSNQYYEEWKTVTKNRTSHLGENLPVTFNTSPAEEYKGKGPYSLVDGNRGYRNFEINWIGWYGTDPEFTIETSELNFKRLKINFLEDQRHWIFTPQKLEIYGLNNESWELIHEIPFGPLIENLSISTITKEVFSEKFSNFTAIKIRCINHKQLPIWRKRKNKAPIVMIDEVELYK